MLRRPASSGPVFLEGRLGKAEPSMVAQPFPILSIWSTCKLRVRPLLRESPISSPQLIIKIKCLFLEMISSLRAGEKMKIAAAGSAPRPP